MSDMLLDLITKQQARVGQAIDLRTGTELQGANDAERALRTIEQSVTTASENQQIQLRTQRLGQLQAQEVATSALQAAGGAPLLNALITRTVQKGEEVSQNLEALRKAKNTSFFGDGPLEWIQARLSLPKITENVQDSAIELNTLQQRAVGVNNAIQEVGQTAQATARTITQASISAETDALAAEWAIKGQKAYLDRIKNNLVGPTAILQAEESKLGMLYNAANFNRQEREFQMSIERMQMQREQQAWTREQAQMLRADRAEQKQFDEQTMFYANMALQARGEQEMDAGQFKDWKNFTPKEEQAKLVQRGRVIQREGIPIIGYSPAEVAGVVMTNPNLQFGDLRDKSLGIIREALTELSAIKGSTDPKTAAQYDALRKDKTGQAAESFVNQYVQGKITSLTANADSPTNPMNFGSLNAFIGTPTSPGVSAIVNTPLVANVLAPATKTGISLDSPSATFNVMLQAIRGEQISSSTAIDNFVEIHKRAVGFHRAALGLKTMGIIMPENSQGHRVTINGKLIDVTNRAEVAALVANGMYNDVRRQQRAAQLPPGMSRDSGTRRITPLPGQFPGGFEPQ